MITDQKYKGGSFKSKNETCPSSLAYRVSDRNAGVLTPRSNELIFEGGEEDEVPRSRPPTQEAGSSRRPVRASVDIAQFGGLTGRSHRSHKAD